MTFLPRLLIIDDLYGRSHAAQRNVERANLCGSLLLKDVTGDENDLPASHEVAAPIAEVVFCRGQTPARASVGHTVENDVLGALEKVRAGWNNGERHRQPWTLVLVDLSFTTGVVTTESDAKTKGMPAGRPTDDDPSTYFGMKLLEVIHDQLPVQPVAILSSMQREDVSREFARLGAVGFLPKPTGYGAEEALKEFIWKHGLLPDPSGAIVGTSLGLLLALRAARRAAGSQRNVIIRGERGSGKELFSQLIHRIGNVDGSRALVSVDSGSLTPELYASVLFGHRRGAFTGATGDSEGMIARADGGDLFFDEVGNMPPDVQAGLLRVLATNVVQPLGSSVGRPVRVRFLSATNGDLEAKAMTGGFREDLLDRLREGGAVVVPALRERRDDISMLVETFLRRIESDLGARRREVEPDALALLVEAPWPGNVRELEACLRGAVANYPDVEHLVPQHLPFAQAATKQSPASHLALRAGKRPRSIEIFDELLTLKPGTQYPADKVVGALVIVESLHAEVVATLVRSALMATRRVTPDNPTGDILIQPAMRLLTGDAVLTGSKAADLVKRLLTPHPALETLLESDPVLRVAWDRALRLRPRASSQPVLKGGSTGGRP